jgi:hypothetical protein
MSPLDLFKGAHEVLVAQSVQQRYPTWEAAIDASPLRPRPPTTRAEATPQILLRPPFKDDPTLAGVAFYIGVGFIQMRVLPGSTQCTYETTVRGGDGGEVRAAFLQAAARLYFHDVQFGQGGQA